MTLESAETLLVPIATGILNWIEIVKLLITIFYNCNLNS